MAVMEFLSQNKLFTTTLASVDSSTATVQYLFNRNTGLGYTSTGYNSTTSTIISISFSAATILSHVLIQNHNLKNFSLYYDNTTTNSLFSTTTNSSTNSYISFNSITVSSIQLKMVDTIQGSVEKKVGELFIGERKLVFERNPTIADFSPMTFRSQVVHNMPDGGTTIFHIRDKYRTKMSWDYVTETFRNDLYSLYSSSLPLYFSPKPTTTGWDGNAYEINWLGDFDFEYSSNVEDSGFGGSMQLSQTPSG